MHTDSGMTGISLSGYMPYMTVASLEMSDEPKQIAKLRSMGILSREGADFGGYWRIILSYHFEGMRRSTLRLYNWRQNWAKKVS